MARVLLFLSAALILSACSCNERLARAYEEPDAGDVDAGLVLPSCRLGGVTGRVCAPDKRTWVSGASVSVTGQDCNGTDFTVTAESAADGTFTLADIPAGSRRLHAVLGAFTQDYDVTVVPGATSTIPDDQLCVAQKQTRIAVVTGPGDQIENLLTGLGLQFDTFAGDATNFDVVAAPFLSDLTRLKNYDLVFIDCAAGKRASSSTVDLGPGERTIASALHDYVAQGGSLYASDWALVFPAVAYPNKMHFKLNGGGSVANPFDATHLMGYAPQTLRADITHPALATFVGKSTIDVAFPHQGGANSLHWGLFDGIDASGDVLIQASTAKLCATSSTSCSSAGASINNVPLAVTFKLGPAGGRGGNLVYTSFHNIAQPSDDVSLVLKYIVLHL